MWDREEDLHLDFPEAWTVREVGPTHLRRLSLRDFSSPVRKLKTIRRVLDERSRRILVYSPHLPEHAVRRVFPNAQRFGAWTDLRRELQMRHPGTAVSVAVFTVD